MIRLDNDITNLKRDVAKIITTGKSVVVIELIFDDTCNSVIITIIIEIATTLSIVDHKTILISYQISRVLMIDV